MKEHSFLFFYISLLLSLALSLPTRAGEEDFRFSQRGGQETLNPSMEILIPVEKLEELSGQSPSTPKQPGWTEPDTDRPGSDYRSFFTSAGPEACQEVCADDPNCRAYTYVRPGIQGRLAVCWLKSEVPEAVPNDCCVSGVKPASGSTGEGMVIVTPLQPTVPDTKGDGDKPGTSTKNPPSDLFKPKDIERDQKKEGTRVEKSSPPYRQDIIIQQPARPRKGAGKANGGKEAPKKRPSEEILESIKIGREQGRQTIIAVQPNKKEPVSPYEDILKAIGRRKTATARAGSEEITKTPSSCKSDAKGGGTSADKNQIVWTPLPAISSRTNPAIGAIERDRIYMVTIAHTGCVYYSSTNSPGGWTPWQSIGPSFRVHPSTPPVIVQNGNTLYLFARGKDDNLHVAYRVRGGYWSGWSRLTSNGSVRGRISVAVTHLSGGGKNLLEFHAVYSSEDNAKKPTLVYLKLNSGWKQQGPAEIWQDALEGTIGTDGESEILAAIRTGSQRLHLEKKVRQASRWTQFQQVGGRVGSGVKGGIFDISNIIYYAGAYHLAYSASYISNPEFGGGYSNSIVHTWVLREKADSGLVQTIADYTPEGGSHPKTTLIVYRNKLVAAYRDMQGFIRYAYRDTADPATPWIGREIVDNSLRADGRPALAAFNMRPKLSGNDYNKDNFGNDLFAAVKGDRANTIGFINFSRAIFLTRIDAQLAIYNSRTGTVCKDQGRADSPVLVSDITKDGRPFYTEIGYVFWTLPNRLLGDAFKKTGEKACMDKVGSGRFDAPRGGTCSSVKYPVLVGKLSDGGCCLNICGGIWHLRNNDYKDFWEEMGHALAGHRLSFHDSGTKKQLKDKGKPYYPAKENEKMTGIPLSALLEGDRLFGKGVRDDRRCDYDAAPGGRCRGFTGYGGNYDVGTRQHSFIYTVYYYFSNGNLLRQWVKDDLSAGKDLLQRKYNWVKKNIFGGVEFRKDNELLIKYLLERS